jgi:hypothetical protein
MVLSRVAFALFIIMGGVGGCAGPHPYNPGQAQLARQGKTEIDGLDFSAFMATEDKNIDAYDQSERQAWRDNALLRRDLMLAQIAASPEDFEKAWLNPTELFGSHLQEILGETPTVEKLGVLAEKLDDAEVTYRSLLDSIRKEAADPFFEGVTLPPCNPAAGVLIPSLTDATRRALTADVGPQVAAVRIERYNEAKRSCDRAADAFAEVSNLTPGTMKIASELTAAKQDLAAAEQLRDEIAQKFDEAVKEINEAAPSAGGKKPSEIAGPALTALHELVAKATGLAASFSSLELNEKRLQQLDSVLTAAATGKLEDASLSQEQRRRAVALGGLPNLADSFYDLAAASGAVPRYALLVVREQVRAGRDRAAAQVAYATARMAILQAELDTLVLELRRYGRSVRYYQQARDRDNVGSLRQKPAVVLGPQSPAAVRERSKAAVGWSAFAWSSAELRMADLEGALNRLAYDRRQADSRIALAEWKGMLVALADGQVGYYDAGIRPEELSALAIQLLQAAGLFTIAAAVN